MNLYGLISIFFFNFAVFAGENKPNEYDPRMIFKDRMVVVNPSQPRTIKGVDAAVVSIDGKKYLELSTKIGSLYLSYLGEISKEDIEKASCQMRREPPSTRGTDVAEERQSLEKHLSEKITVYASFIMKTIGEKCTNRVEQLAISENPGEVGLTVKQNSSKYRIYNRFEPRDAHKRPLKSQVSPAVGFGLDF